MSWGWWCLLAAVVLWISFNWVAPLAIFLRGERISPGRLPPELFTSGEARAVQFYLDDLYFGYGYSVWAPPWNVVVFDRKFFAKASAPLLKFVIAHELAHFSLGHHYTRWLLIVLGVGLTPWARKTFERYEKEADAEASRRTGLVRTLFSEDLPAL